MTAGYDIVSHALDGSGFKRLTDTPGYDAEATLSPDGKTIVFTSVRDGDLEIYTMATDGTNVRRLTNEPGYDGGPFFSHDGRRVVYRRDFSIDHPNPRGRNFDLWVIRQDGMGLEQVTSEPTFDGFPMFSPDGKQLVFASNRGGKAAGETNLFVARLGGVTQPGWVSPIRPRFGSCLTGKRIPLR